MYVSEVVGILNSSKIFFSENKLNLFYFLLHKNFGMSKIATFSDFATCRNRPKSARKRGSKIATFAINRNIWSHWRRPPNSKVGLDRVWTRDSRLEDSRPIFQDSKDSRLEEKTRESFPKGINYPFEILYNKLIQVISFL